MTEDLLFVYGTLRRGSGHRMHDVLARASSFVDRGVFQGRLFLVAHYPGAVASRDPSARVIGDTFRLHHPETLLAELDRYESCDPKDPASPYVRRIEHVTLDSGEQVPAWIYLYNRSTAALSMIPSGDFLADVR